MDKFTPKQKKELKRIIIALVMFAALFIIEHFIYSGMIIDALYLVPYFIVGYDVIRKCLIGIKNRQLFDESFLMTVATVGAFGCGEFGEAVAVMLFYQVGEFFQDYAVGKSRGAITELMDIAPEYANRESEDGSIEVIDPDDIEVGDILVVKPGEKIPTDALVVEGQGLINTSALTGESVPREVKTGDSVISGCVNGDDLLKVQALKEYDDSTVMQILEMVENAASRKSVTESFITRFAKYYTPAVVIAAVVLAFLPPILSGDFTGEFGKWLLRACTFLVISCPCALVISVPLAFFGGIGAASKEGVLVKGSNYLEQMANIDTIVSDKTGTLTEGKFSVSYIEAADDLSTDELIRLAAAAESGSTHPIAAAINEACTKPYPASKVKDAHVSAGGGVTATIGKDKIIVGKKSYLEDAGIEVQDMTTDVSGTHCYVGRNGKYIGTIVVADRPKENAKSALSDILRAGIRRIVMLTGDSEEVAASVANELGFQDYRAALLPQDKVSVVEELIAVIKASTKGKGKLAFIGDGINDAPVLSISDVGIAMGSLGSDAAIEAADVVIMDDDITRIPKLIQIAKKTLGISRANIVFALFVKFSCLILGVVGIANMWVAVFADVGVAVICILNSMRMLIKEKD